MPQNLPEHERCITYAHCEEPGGPRFRQYAKDAIPKWAVDVQEDIAEGGDGGADFLAPQR